MTTRKAYAYLLVLLLCAPLWARATGPDYELAAKRPALAEYIQVHYPNQLTDPHKKKRRCFSQFGYNLSFFRWKLFDIAQFVEPGDFGTHSYGQPSMKEKNGALYTCKGGFIDLSHVRAAADWTVYLTFKIINDTCGFALPPEFGSLQLSFKDLDQLSMHDVASLSQKIAYERLLWHEIVSWHYHGPNHLNSEQQSAFTPEDIYSNLLGTQVGKDIALRILTMHEDLTYEEIATQEIYKAIQDLLPLNVEACKQAYDKVDRFVQLQLPENKRNHDVWWDSNIIFRDQRYVFKRYMAIGPSLEPWLVPNQNELGCNCDGKGEVLPVPQYTLSGLPFHKYYTFSITPDPILFYSKTDGKQLHPEFGPFTTHHIGQIVAYVGKQIESTLMAGYSERDSYDPVPSFGKVKRVQ